MDKARIGNGIFVEVEYGMIELTLEDEFGISDSITLSPDAYETLVNFVAAAKKAGEL